MAQSTAPILFQSGALDPNHPLRISAVLDRLSEPPPGWTDTLLERVQVFEWCIRSGCLEHSVEPGVLSALPSSTMETGRAFAVQWPSFPFGNSGLAMMVRLLLAAPIAFSEIRIEGSPTSPTSVSKIDAVQSHLEECPRIRQPLNLLIELQPAPRWMCIDIVPSQGVSDQMATQLEAMLRNWTKICHLGGLSPVSGDLRVTSCDIGMNAPERGDDFFSAQIAVDGILPQAVGSLVNILEHFSVHVSRLDEVTIQ